MSYHFSDHAAAAIPTRYHWKATKIHNRDKDIIDGQVYTAEEGTLILFLELYDGLGGKRNALAERIPAGMGKVQYVVTPAGGRAATKYLVVEAGAELSAVRIDTKNLLGAYTIQLLGRTLLLQVGPAIASPEPAVIAKPKRPPTGPTGNA